MEELNSIEKVLIEAKKVAYERVYIPKHIKEKYEFKITAKSAMIVDKKSSAEADKKSKK